MGSWDAAIFSDDLAADVRTQYRELLEDGVADDEATGRVIESYGHLDADEEHVLWLALAATQSSLGRLDDQIRERALGVIDTGRGLEPWEEAGPKALAKRKALLARLRDQLTSPQPKRKPVRRPWRYVTDLEPGDVLSFTASNGAVAVLRVARVDEQRVNVAPIVQWLDWDGDAAPAGSELGRLNVRRRRIGALEVERTVRVAKGSVRDPDWHESGFALLERGESRPGDSEETPRSHAVWSGLARILERELTVSASQRASG
jgi:hypothetical protein